jgi:hypothetical protein
VLKSKNKSWWDYLPKFYMSRPRTAMPQVTDMKSLIDHLMIMGITHAFLKLRHTDIAPSQIEINQRKVNSMRSAYKKGKLNIEDQKIIVSKDMFVIDGHHRFALSRLENLPIHACVLNIPLKRALEILGETGCPGVTYDPGD